MTTTAASQTAIARPQRRAMTLKWSVVLAAMVLATVLDGIASFDAGKLTVETMASGDQAAITLPADRCGPGCAIMVAANQTGDAFIARSE